MIIQRIDWEYDYQSEGLLMLDVSVVVCAKNAERTLERSLESIKNNNPSEIIVVDDGSTDCTPEIAKRYTHRICFNEGRGLAYARQLGCENATHQYVSYVDSDVILPPNCLQTMLVEMQERGYAGISAQAISPENTSYWEWGEDQHLRMMFNKPGDKKLIPTRATIFLRDVILEYGFDCFFKGAAEDHDLCFRLRKNGYTLGVSSAFIYHQHRASGKAFIRQRIWYGRGNARLFWRHKLLARLIESPLLFFFGAFVCIRKRSLRPLPFYWVWAVSTGVGTLSEVPKLVLHK
ncbi:MAG: glycosyltransferase [bacterium]|nr:glycosyltransferase [bacterium]